VLCNCSSRVSRCCVCVGVVGCCVVVVFWVIVAVVIAKVLVVICVSGWDGSV
jgi:hypothetical protein